ncbi:MULTISPECIES: hypothetical protein [unclassified Coleofasciculus]|uniref:hypothetical protein n=1 Tax=unclassified Coleofasciculus TaxID=2692782 RepID=UPI001880BC6A|nr:MULTISPECIES: hypothetical protein [unclassified Coleofasciculus]MBE9128165.1 hypothetical protein [Coleofasciculus sp. LEGE 07081]MBE9149734.1 hypothetical protein [Coleofasciculus sp. LEGE 07092]
MIQSGNVREQNSTDTPVQESITAKRSPSFEDSPRLNNTASIPSQSSIKVPFEICSESTSWVRPSQSEQLQKLRNLPQYTADFDSGFNSLFQTFWTHSIFSFTNYGLSARIEPIYLSGLWTILDNTWNCYESTRVERINSGKIAEIWVLAHQVISFQWVGNRYVMVVAPTQQGVQLIQFPRRENQSSLPLTVVTEDGRELEIIDAGLKTE